MLCLQCNAKNLDGAKFCKSCGEAIATQGNNQRSCINGHVLEDDWDTCPWCGSGVDSKGLGTQASVKSTEVKPVRRKTVKEPTINETALSTPGSNVSVNQKLEPIRQQTKPKRRATVVLRPNSSGKSGATRPKLVGFLVSYTLNPSGQAFEIREGRHVLGSSNNATIAISGDTAISSEHAILLYRSSQFILQDNLSTNGTLVDGEEIIGQVVLQHGSLIKIGETKFFLVAIDQHPDRGE